MHEKEIIRKQGTDTTRSLVSSSFSDCIHFINKSYHYQGFNRYYYYFLFFVIQLRMSTVDVKKKVSVILVQNKPAQAMHLRTTELN